jgi:hypothetical protein
MPGTDKNKSSRADRLRKVQAGLKKYYTNVNLTLAGTSYTPSALQDILQADVAADDASTMAREKWLTAVKAAQDVHLRTNPVVRAIAAQVRAQHGETQASGDILAEFGFAPRKVAPRTVDDKASAVAQLRATREARGTKGKRQKAKVKGQVPATGAKGGSAGSHATPSDSGTSGNQSASAHSGPAAPAASASTNPSHA